MGSSNMKVFWQLFNVFLGFTLIVGAVCIGMLLYSTMATFSPTTAPIFAASIAAFTALIGSITTIIVVMVTNKRSLDAQSKSQESVLDLQKRQLFYQTIQGKNELLANMRKDWIEDLRSLISNYSLENLSLQVIFLELKQAEYKYKMNKNSNELHMEYQKCVYNKNENFKKTQDYRFKISYLLNNKNDKNMLDLNKIMDNLYSKIIDLGFSFKDTQMSELLKNEDFKEILELRYQFIEVSENLLKAEWEKLKKELSEAENKIEIWIESSSTNR